MNYVGLNAPEPLVLVCATIVIGIVVLLVRSTKR
jgi:hypothetical protein